MLPPKKDPEFPGVPVGLKPDDIFVNVIDWSTLVGNRLSTATYSLTVTDVTTRVEKSKTIAVFNGNGFANLVPKVVDGCLANFSKCPNGVTFR